MTFTAKPNALYLCDNGRCVCGIHLGATAAATGHDISGQSVYQIVPADHDVGTPPFKCESCGATFGRSVRKGTIRPVLTRETGKGGCTVHDYGMGGAK